MIELNENEIMATLYTSVLNDDEIRVCKDGDNYGRRGGSSVKIVYYTYLNEWCNRENVKYFRTIETALKWYKKEFRGKVIEQGRNSILEWKEDDDHYVWNGEDIDGNAKILSTKLAVGKVDIEEDADGFIVAYVREFDDHYDKEGDDNERE